jgi:hypothetical protein
LTFESVASVASRAPVAGSTMPTVIVSYAVVVVADSAVVIRYQNCREALPAGTTTCS